MDNRNIIVIGGSSGATTPLKSILSHFTPDLPAAIFVVLHVPSGGCGILSTVAGAAGRLPVHEVKEDLRFEPGHVYLAIPDRHLLLTEDRIILGRGPRENMMRPAIDATFRSAALYHGPRVIGVVLSGFLSDGASGLNAIKRCGGIAVVQDPSDAIADEMPRNALDSTTVDLCVPGTRLGKLLTELTEENAGPSLPIPADIRFEVEIAAGGPSDGKRLRRFSDPAALTCPACGGVLSKLKVGTPLRFRCQVGHAYTAEALAQEQEDSVDEALRVALRIIEERAELVERMAEEGRQTGRAAVAEMYAARATEYRAHADTIRRTVLATLTTEEDEEN